MPLPSRTSHDVVWGMMRAGSRQQCTGLYLQMYVHVCNGVVRHIRATSSDGLLFADCVNYVHGPIEELGLAGIAEPEDQDQMLAQVRGQPLDA